MDNDKDYIDNMLNTIIASTLKKARESQNLTLEQLSKKSGVSKQNIYYYEIGRNRVKAEKFIKICEALGLNPGEVFDEINLKYYKTAKI